MLTKMHGCLRKMPMVRDVDLLSLGNTTLFFFLYSLLHHLTALKVPLSFLPLAVFLGLLRLFFLIGYLMELSYSISSDSTHRPVTDKYRVMGKYELGPDCTHPHIPYTHHTYTYHTYTCIPHTQTLTIYTNTHRKCLFPFSFVSWIK